MRCLKKSLIELLTLLVPTWFIVISTTTWDCSFCGIDNGAAEVLVNIINAGCIRRGEIPSKPVCDVIVLFPVGLPKVPSLEGFSWNWDDSPGTLDKRSSRGDKRIS